MRSFRDWLSGTSLQHWLCESRCGEPRQCCMRSCRCPNPRGGGGLIPEVGAHVLVRLLYWPRDSGIAENANLAQRLGSPLARGWLYHHGSWRMSLYESLRMDKTWRRAHRRVRLPLWG